MSLKKQVNTEVRACLKSFGNRNPGHRGLYECVAERLYGPDARIQIGNNKAHAEVSAQVFRALRTKDARSHGVKKARR